MKKTGKMILKGLGWVMVGALLFVAGVAIYDLIKEKDDRRTLEERGYSNLVSVGDHSLNVYKAGNENGDHTFVTLSGWSDGSAFIGWRPLTSAFEDENEFIFIDRPGYGLSDDVTDNMDIDEVVEDYRTALRNSGEEGPYILLAHSLGGLYTAYWESAYPDEIEGVIIMDGTIPIDDETQAEDFDLSWWQEASISAELDWMFLTARTGLIRLAPSGYEDLFYRLTDEDQELAVALVNFTIGSTQALYEMQQFATGDPQNWVWHHTVTNDIPKVYIAASEYEEAIEYSERIGNMEVYDLPGDHVIFLDRTEDCIEIIGDFMERLD
ncbi:MAG: alpha/beta hydrolase [Clostridiales bacterium]|nr:alpha/beta hydrolase [Clostridiales bacterium]